MVSIPFDFYTDTNQTGVLHTTHITGFIKAAGAPLADTTVADANFGASGYLRLKLTTTIHLVAEASLFGGSATKDINAGNAILPGTWYWVDVFIVPGDSGTAGVNIRLGGVCTAPGGSSPGLQTADTGVHSYGSAGTIYTLNAQFGLGASTSSAYASWPNSVGWELSKFCLRQVAVGWNNYQTVVIPSADYGVDGNIVAYWKCRDTTGAQTTLLDSSGHNYNILGTFTVVADGPYA